MSPDWMPTLSAGSHCPNEGKACVMEYVSLLAGEEWSDHPACTHPGLAGAARIINDHLSDADRHLLVPLIGRLFGTAPTNNEDERMVSMRMAIWCAKQAASHSTHWTAIRAAEAWANDPSPRNVAKAIEAADGAHPIAGFPGARAVAGVGRALQSPPAPVSDPDWAFQASVSASYAATAVARRTTDPHERVAFLSGLLDEYDRLTGRTKHRQVTDDELRALAAAIT